MYLYFLKPLNSMDFIKKLHSKQNENQEQIGKTINVKFLKTQEK